MSKTTPPLAETLATLKELGANFDKALDDVNLNRPVPKARLAFENASRRLAMGVAGYLPTILTAAEQAEKYREALEEVVAACWTCGGKGEINNGRWIGDVRIEPCPAHRCCIARKALEAP